MVGWALLVGTSARVATSRFQQRRSSGPGTCTASTSTLLQLPQPHPTATSTSACLLRPAGAGLAGARAAQYLSSKGMRVVVLEARSRAGGRTATATATSGGYPLELGAAWLHGTTGNPLVPVATAASVSLASRATRWGNTQLYLWDGRAASDAQEAG